MDVVVDRIVVREDQRSRIADSLELAFNEDDGCAILLTQMKRDDDFRDHHFSAIVMHGMRRKF